jgi:hypothetical protein
MAETGTLTRADIAEHINRQVGLSRADASAVIESLLTHVIDALVDGKFRALALSSCGTRANGLAVIRRPVSKCPSRRAAFSLSAPAKGCAKR